MIYIYVDDIVIMGNNAREIVALKTYLSKTFHLKDLGHLSYFLGLQFSRSSNGFFLDQKKYAGEIINLAHLNDGKTNDTPL